MKIKDAIALPSQASQLWPRIKKYLDSLPDDDVRTTKEVVRAIGCGESSLTNRVALESPEIRAYWEAIPSGRGPMIRVYGNPKAIKELRRQLTP